MRESGTRSPSGSMCMELTGGQGLEDWAESGPPSLVTPTPSSSMSSSPGEINMIEHGSGAASGQKQGEILVPQSSYTFPRIMMGTNISPQTLMSLL